MMWSLRVHALLENYDLAHHLDGSKPPPAATITAGDITSVNPAYNLWKRQDKLIYSSLIGVISVTIQPTLARSQSTSDIWCILASIYAKASKGHIKQIKHQLKQWTKGTKSIDEYLQGLTMKFDQLALLCKHVDHEDQLEYAFEGLPEEYKTVVNQLEGRDVSPSLTEAHEKLLNHEAKLLMLNTISAVAPISANVTITRQTSHPRQHFNQKSWRPPNQNNNHQPDKGNPKGYQGKCQLCGVHGHNAKRCPQLYKQQP